MKFRNDISFLRALSIIAVLLYHFKFTYFKGGFIGVDIFFVISGYLMTRIILTGFSKNNFSIFDFYKKRIFRILPALLVMITSFAILIYFFIPTQFINYMKVYSSSSLFLSNIFLYNLNAGYFNAPQQLNFLLHTWSLSVEWQFYMLYPLVLMVFKKAYLNKKLFNFFYLGIIFLSIGLMVLHYLFSHSYSFYMLDTRAWEMMFGGLAFLYRDLFEHKKINLKKNLFYLSFFIILCFLVLIDEHYIRWWPFITTVIPVGCTALILILNLDFKLFDNKIIKYIGDISYSLYLWHWPFFVFSIFFGLNDNLIHKIIFIMISVIFAILSYHFIEKRSYQNKYKLILSFALLVFLSSYFVSTINPKYLFSKTIANLVSTTTDYKESSEFSKQFSRGNKHLLDSQSFKNYDLENLKINKHKKNIILIGDSHAGMFSQTLNNIIDKRKYNLIQVTGDATYPMIDAEIGYPGPKELFNFFFKYYFPKHYRDIDFVIISANFYDFYKDDLVKKINFNENYFKKYNVPVMYLGQTDNYPIDFPTHFYLKEEFNVENSENKGLTAKVYLTNKYLMKRLGNRYINLLDCKIIKISKNGMPYIHDQNHLTYYGTEQYRSFIAKSLPLNK